MPIPEPTADPDTSPQPADKNLSPGDIADQTLTKRAQRAEEQASSLETQLARLQSELDQSRAALTDADRQHEVDMALTQAGAVDLDTARLLAQQQITDTPGVSTADLITALARTKPYLFRPSSRASHSAMSPCIDDARSALCDAADRAARTGDRASLLAYLRARRGA